jgi:hypothetical protein
MKKQPAGRGTPNLGSYSFPHTYLRGRAMIGFRYIPTDTANAIRFDAEDDGEEQRCPWSYAKSCGSCFKMMSGFDPRCENLCFYEIRFTVTLMAPSPTRRRRMGSTTPGSLRQRNGPTTRRGKLRSLSCHTSDGGISPSSVGYRQAFTPCGRRLSKGHVNSIERRSHSRGRNERSSPLKGGSRVPPSSPRTPPR